MAAVSVAVQRTTLPSSSTTHDVTVSGFGTPKAALFIFYRDSGTAGNANEQNAVMGYGFTDGTNHFAAYADWLEGSSTHQGERAQSTAKVAILTDDNANNVEFDSWTTDGVTLDVTNGSGLTDCHLDVVFFNGDDLSAAVGDFAVPGSSGSTRTVSGLSFEPNLIFATSACIANSVNQANSVMSFGVAHNDGGTITQALIARGAASNTNDLGWMQRNDGFCGQAYTQNSDWRQEVTAFNSDGFTVTERDHNAGSDDIGYLALDLGSTINAKLTPSYGTPTTTGTDTISASFTPQFFLGVFGRHTTSANISNTDTSLAEVIGNVITDGTQTFYNQTQVDRNNSTTGVTATYRSSGSAEALYLFTDATANNQFDETLLAEATFDSFSSTGSVLDFSTVSGNGSGESYYGFALQIEEDADTANTAAVSTSSAAATSALSASVLVDTDVATSAPAASSGVAVVVQVAASGQTSAPVASSSLAAAVAVDATADTTAPAPSTSATAAVGSLTISGTVTTAAPAASTGATAVVSVSGSIGTASPSAASSLVADVLVTADVATSAPAAATEASCVFSISTAVTTQSLAAVTSATAVASAAVDSAVFTILPVKESATFHAGPVSEDFTSEQAKTFND